MSSAYLTPFHQQLYDFEIHLFTLRTTVGLVHNLGCKQCYSSVGPGSVPEYLSWYSCSRIQSGGNLCNKKKHLNPAVFDSNEQCYFEVTPSWKAGFLLHTWRKDPCSFPGENHGHTQSCWKGLPFNKVSLWYSDLRSNIKNIFHVCVYIEKISSAWACLLSYQLLQHLQCDVKTTWSLTLLTL